MRLKDFPKVLPNVLPKALKDLPNVLKDSPKVLPKVAMHSLAVAMHSLRLVLYCIPSWRLYFFRVLLRLYLFQYYIFSYVDRRP